MTKKTLFKKKKKADALPTRITNDTVAEHREKVLAGGRKLKYPVQYTKRKLVRNTIILSIVGLLLLVVLGWAQLYVWKDTGDVAYRMTRILPLPVAKIEGEFVRYSDYLLYHRSTLATLTKQGLSQGDNADRIEFQQRQAMDRALEDAYVRKLAREQQVEVTQERVNDIIRQRREETGLSERAYEAVVRDNLNWSLEELRTAMYNTLLRQEVAYALDDQASGLVEKTQAALRENQTLEQIAQQLGDTVQYRANVDVPTDNADGGLTKAAAGLAVGATSGPVRTLDGDGYYFIARQAGAEGRVHFHYLRIPLTKFKQQFEQVKAGPAVQLFITLKETQNAQ